MIILILFPFLFFVLLIVLLAVGSPVSAGASQ
jgi:hypothetical protein